MSTHSKIVAKRRQLSLVGVSQPERSKLVDDNSLLHDYQIVEKQPVQTAVPLNTTLSIIVHFATWTFAGLYFLQRTRSLYLDISTWAMVIYLCEASMVLQEFHSAIELSFSLFGSSKTITQSQYVLKGKSAPKVHVLVT